MLDIKANMIQILTPLEIYNLEPKSSTDLEISTYSKFLQTVNNQINNLLNESFVQTAKDFGLLSKIQLLSLNIDNSDSINQKRQKILNALSTDPSNFNKNDIINSFKSIGFNCNIKEDTKNESITISFKDKKPSNISSFKEFVLKMLPAHLDVIFDTGRETTWDDLNDMVIDTTHEISWDSI